LKTSNTIPQNFGYLSSIQQNIAYWTSVQVKTVCPSELFPCPEILFGKQTLHRKVLNRAHTTVSSQCGRTCTHTLQTCQPHKNVPQQPVRCLHNLLNILIQVANKMGLQK
jgi:hypothetical protein